MPGLDTPRVRGVPPEEQLALTEFFRSVTDWIEEPVMISPCEKVMNLKLACRTHILYLRGIKSADTAAPYLKRLYEFKKLLEDYVRI